MKNRYFGDVNDYVKYGVLRCLARAGFSIGVCWMLTPDDIRTDGRRVNYLSHPRNWEQHDVDLFWHLFQTLAAPDGKNIRHIEKKGWIHNARFFGKDVPDPKSARLRWFEDALEKLDGSDLLFFDPDNGIEVQSKPMGRKDSSKYIYWEELAKAWKLNRSLLVFQHFPRVKRDEFISEKTKEIKFRLDNSSIVPLRSPNVLFLLAYRQGDIPRIRKALNLIDEKWSQRVLIVKK
jgi:hypothetical protein